MVLLVEPWVSFGSLVRMLRWASSFIILSGALFTFNSVDVSERRNMKSYSVGPNVIVRKWQPAADGGALSLCAPASSVVSQAMCR
jgi:hypothetical protein